MTGPDFDTHSEIKGADLEPPTRLHVRIVDDVQTVISVPGIQRIH